MRYTGADLIRASLIVAMCGAAALTTNSCANSDANSKLAHKKHSAEWPADDTITQWAKDALRLDPRVSSNDIKIETLNGIVKLRGTTDSVQESKYAKLEVMKIDGVRGIINELTVRPPERSDTQIKNDVAERLIHSPAVHCDDLAVHVTAGAVTLNGKVPSWNELDYATRLAGEVRGVSDVINEMEISFPRRKDDEQIRDEVVGTIDGDPYLTGLPITVSVADGAVTLEGTVGNAYEKERAETDALRSGFVYAVNNRLSTDWLKERGVRENRPTATDEQVKSAVRDSLYQDLRIKRPSDINVEASQQVVTLRGTVPHYYQKMIAGRDARDIVGVKDVVNLIEIDTSSKDDAAIAVDLKHALDTDYVLADRQIKVSVHDGIATLNGEVRSPFEKEHVQDVAGSILGVRDVVNVVLVRPAVGYSDEVLKENIDRRLSANWKTRWVAPRIHVVVEDGSATLTGNVDSWSERLEAGWVTNHVDGVTDVTNNLTLAGSEAPAVSLLDRPGRDADE